MTKLKIPSTQILLTEDIYIQYNIGFVVTRKLGTYGEKSVKAGEKYLPTDGLTFKDVDSAVRGVKKHYNVDVNHEDVEKAYEEAKVAYLVSQAKKPKPKGGFKKRDK